MAWWETKKGEYQERWGESITIEKGRFLSTIDGGDVYTQKTTPLMVVVMVVI